MTTQEAHAQLDALLLLPEDWWVDMDGSTAPIPTRDAVETAKRIVDRFARVGHTPTEIDADAMGGVAVYFGLLWVSVFNSGGETFCFVDTGRGVSEERALLRLSGKSDVPPTSRVEDDCG